MPKQKRQVIVTFAGDIDKYMELINSEDPCKTYASIATLVREDLKDIFLHSNLKITTRLVPLKKEK